MPPPSDSPAPDETALLERARAGESAALTELMTRHRIPVLRFAVKVCVSPEDAEDAVQETLLSLTRYVGAFRGAARLSTWLFTVTRNHCLRLARRAISEARGADPLTLDPLTPEDLLAHEQLRARVAEVLRGMPSEAAEVLLRREILGESGEEVSRALGIGLPAVKSRLHRARAELRRRLLESLRAD